MIGVELGLGQGVDGVGLRVRAITWTRTRYLHIMI